VEVVVRRGRIIVRRPNVRRYRLADLLRGVRESNIHPETDTDPPVGREIW